jgi:hypothetical protein
MEGTRRARTNTASFGRSSRRGGANDEEHCTNRSEVHQLFINWKDKDHFGNLTISSEL